LTDLMKVAQQNQVQIPMTIRGNPALKVDAHHWDLSGGKGPTRADDERELANHLGGPIGEPDETDPDFQDNLNLAKVTAINKAAASKKIYLYGKGAKGKFFRIPGVEEICMQLERMLSRQLADQGGSDRLTMEEQYDMLKDKVTLVAGNQSAFIKSLLITGAPSSGKTFSVMQTITKELGLANGKDYVVKKGSITPNAMYRTFIERIDGLIIFDDCDSVVEDKNGINMLKGALDTDPVREISNDNRTTMNTATMDPEERKEVVDAISRIFRNRATQADLIRFDHLIKKKKKPVNSEPLDDFSDDEFGDDDDFDLNIDDEEGNDSEGKDGDEYGVDPEKLHELQQYFTAHLPNLIDFRGRIIFISNMDESDWDGAILSRAFTVNMQFTSGEMLDYIDKIKDHLKTPNVTDEQKQEVMDYLRELYTTGKLKRQVNFRLVQQAFDLRLATNWKKMIAML
jgi:hypothetical protein